MWLEPTASTLESPTIGGGTMKRILVATDGSPSAAEATQFGVDLAAEHDAELVFAHVVPEFDLIPATPFQIGGVFPHDPGKHDEELLEQAADLAAQAGVVATTALLRGDTVEAIAEYAESHDVDLVVVGSRGRGAIAGTLLGSVSLGLLGRAGRPVAIVRGAEARRESPDALSVVTRN
jgi:nucleotide-binding universal stress UspA family protein